jgi:hypothetical protein
MKRILDRLMLSDLSEASDPFFLDQHEVQAILYFGTGGMFPDDIKLYHHPALSDGSLSPEMLKDGIDFLRESLRTGRRVLAVGASGATIITAYLAEMGMSHSQAVEMLGVHSNIQPDSYLIYSHENELRKRSTITLGHH